jgi:uncharacterized repeat protein (TIGR01451 family)
MKRKIAGLLILCLLMAALLPSVALAATSAEFTVTQSPDNMTEAGALSVVIKVSNTSASTTLAGMTMTGDKSANIGDVAPGASKKVTMSFDITASELTTPLSFVFNWTEDGTAQTKTITVIPQSGAAEPAVTLTRTSDIKTVAQGGKIALTYTIKNTGTVAVSGLTLKDANLSTSAIASNIALDPGASKEIPFTYTMGSKKVTSSPVVSYTYNGKAYEARPSDTLELTPAEAVLAVTVSAADATAEGQLFTITLKNTGNVDITNIKVTDELGKTVNASAISVAVGKSAELTYNIITTEARNVVFSINGTDSTGKAYAYQTQSYPITPYMNPDEARIAFTATMTESLGSGSFKIQFVIQNLGGKDLTDLVITESVLGQIDTLSSLASGSTKQLEKRIEPGMNANLTFKVEGKDDTGAVYNATATLALDPSLLVSAAPTAAEASATPKPTTGGGSVLWTVLIVLIVLVALAGTALIILTVQERKKRRNAEIEEARRERRAGGMSPNKPRPPQQPQQQARPPQQPQQQARTQQHQRPPQRPMRKEEEAFYARPKPPARPSAAGAQQPARQNPQGAQPIPPRQTPSAQQRPAQQRPKQRYEDIDDYADYEDDYSQHADYRNAPDADKPKSPRSEMPQQPKPKTDEGKKDDLGWDLFGDD